LFLLCENASCKNEMPFRADEMAFHNYEMASRRNEMPFRCDKKTNIK